MPIHVAGRRPLPEDRGQALRRWPRLIAHLIVESNGYFTPEKAANALAHYAHGVLFGSELHAYLAGQRLSSPTASVDEIEQVCRDVERDLIAAAFAARWQHIADPDYVIALGLVLRALTSGSSGRSLSSW